MIASEEQYHITQDRILSFQHSLETLDAAPPGDPLEHQTQRAGLASMLATLRREAAMWEAGIREPVPGEPQRVNPDVSIAQVNAMSDAEFEESGRRLAVRLKQAQIANIDRQIAIAQACIADWRRHRAWLEREIADLGSDAPLTQHSVAS